MHVGAISITIHSSLSMVFCVISIALEYFSQWFSRTKIGTTSMIFEADQCTVIPTDSHVPYAEGNVRSFMDGPCVEYSKSPHIRAICWPVVMCQQLVATTDRQHWRIVFNCSPQADTLYLIQILSNRGLLFILATPDKQHIILIRCQGVTNAQANNAQRYTTQLTTSSQCQDIAPVSIQIQLIGIEVPQREREAWC